jgi:hypothetical protein
MGSSTSAPPRMTRAVDGCSLTSARSAAAVSRRARASSAFPAVTSEMITITASK